MTYSSISQRSRRTCRPSGVCDFISRQWVDYTGRPAESQLDYGWLDSVHPDERDRVVNAWRAAVKREDAYDIEYRIVRADGEIRWIRDKAFPIRNASGEIYRVVGVAQDITVNKNLIRDLNAERIRLKNVIAEELGEFGDIKIDHASRL